MEPWERGVDVFEYATIATITLCMVVIGFMEGKQGSCGPSLHQWAMCRDLLVGLVSCACARRREGGSEGDGGGVM